MSEKSTPQKPPSSQALWTTSRRIYRSTSWMPMRFPSRSFGQFACMFRTPLNMHANCPKDRLGNRMGIHDVERYIRRDVVHSAWEEGGFWGVDFSDIHYPKHAAYYVPPA